MRSSQVLLARNYTQYYTCNGFLTSIIYNILDGTAMMQIINGKTCNVLSQILYEICLYMQVKISQYNNF
jgi:hypothetical protein